MSESEIVAKSAEKSPNFHDLISKFHLVGVSKPSITLKVGVLW